MMSLQCRDDVDEICSFPRVHLALSHPSVRVRLGDNPLGLVQFGAMHFEERGVRPEVRTVEAGVRVRTRTSHDWDRTVAIRQSLSQHAASEPLQIGRVVDPILCNHFAGDIDQRAFQILRQFVLHGGVVDMGVAARHLRTLVAEITLDDVVRNSEIDHARSNGVTELMRLEAEQLAVCSAYVVIVGKAIDPVSEAGLLENPSFRVWEEERRLYPSGAHCGLLFLHQACDYGRHRDRVLPSNFSLQVTQIVNAARILRETVNRKLQEFADSHAALLKDQDHSPPRSPEIVKVAIELIQNRRGQIAWLRLGRLRHLLVIDQSFGSDWEPSLTVRHLQEVSQIENVVLGASRAHSFLQIVEVVEQQSACDVLCLGLRLHLCKEVREASQATAPVSGRCSPSKAVDSTSGRVSQRHAATPAGR